MGTQAQGSKDCLQTLLSQLGPAPVKPSSVGVGPNGALQSAGPTATSSTGSVAAAAYAASVAASVAASLPANNMMAASQPVGNMHGVRGVGAAAADSTSTCAEPTQTFTDSQPSRSQPGSTRAGTQPPPEPSLPASFTSSPQEKPLPPLKLPPPNLLAPAVTQNLPSARGGNHAAARKHPHAATATFGAPPDQRGDVWGAAAQPTQDVPPGLTADGARPLPNDAPWGEPLANGPRESMRLPPHLATIPHNGPLFLNQAAQAPPPPAQGSHQAFSADPRFQQMQPPAPGPHWGVPQAQQAPPQWAGPPFPQPPHHVPAYPSNGAAPVDTHSWLPPTLSNLPPTPHSADTSVSNQAPSTHHSLATASAATPGPPRGPAAEAIPPPLEGRSEQSALSSQVQASLEQASEVQHSSGPLSTLFPPPQAKAQQHPGAPVPWGPPGSISWQGPHGNHAPQPGVPHYNGTSQPPWQAARPGAHAGHWNAGAAPPPTRYAPQPGYQQQGPMHPGAQPPPHMQQQPHSTYPPAPGATQWPQGPPQGHYVHQPYPGAHAAPWHGLDPPPQIVPPHAHAAPPNHHSHVQAGQIPPQRGAAAVAQPAAAPAAPQLLGPHVAQTDARQDEPDPLDAIISDPNSVRAPVGGASHARGDGRTQPRPPTAAYVSTSQPPLPPSTPPSLSPPPGLFARSDVPARSPDRPIELVTQSPTPVAAQHAPDGPPAQPRAPTTPPPPAAPVDALATLFGSAVAVAQPSRPSDGSAEPPSRSAIDISTLFGAPTEAADVEQPYSEPPWEYTGPDSAAMRDRVLQLAGNRSNATRAAPRGTVNPHVPLDALSAQCVSLVESLAPSSGELAALHATFERIRALLESRYPGCSVHLFGSAANGLCVANNNDLDVTLVVTDAELARAAASRRASEAEAQAEHDAAKEAAAAAPDGAPEAAPAEGGEAGKGAHKPGGDKRRKWAATEGHAGKAQLVTELGAFFEAEGMDVRRYLRLTQAILTLDKARIPVLKFTVPATGTKVDITINNELPLHNTRLLKAYADTDARVRQLIFLVKHWAKQRSINDAYHGTLSSYAWVLLSVFVTQRAGIVPLLQLPPAAVDTSVRVDGQDWRVRYSPDVAPHRTAAAAHPLPLAGLLTMFFDYFASRFDFMTDVVCPARGDVASKADLGWTTKTNQSEYHLVSIQDPFLLKHDLGRTVDKTSRDTLQREFRRAAEVMYTSRTPLAELLQPYRAADELHRKGPGPSGGRGGGGRGGRGGAGGGRRPDGGSSGRGARRGGPGGRGRS